MNLDLFKEILDIESTSGQERYLAEFLERRFPEIDSKCACTRYEVGDGTLNLLFRWDNAETTSQLPKVILCSHLDTVPPYFAPEFKKIRAGVTLPDGKIAEQDDLLITGRGSCDAKGQFFSMWSACSSLASESMSEKNDFGLLLLSGEETGSFGAKAFDRDYPGAEYLIVGEPTDNLMVSASKGTKSYSVTIHGKACHSGYPEIGHSAVETFVEFVEKLRGIDFPEDEVLGPTTWNIGKLLSDNPQNILSPELSFRLYFRTTFASDVMVQEIMERMRSKDIDIEAFGGDTPMRYATFDGIGTKPVAFGSDTPRMNKFTHRSLCGPGSIFVAHTPREYVLLSDLEKAQSQYETLLKKIIDN